MCSLFFYWYSYQRDLHSFPTRRSSDLGFEVACEIRLKFKELLEKPVAVGMESIINLLAPTERDRSVRSEEHTSELQSRQYLVCRLLLEKKKKRSIPIAE